MSILEAWNRFIKPTLPFLPNPAEAFEAGWVAAKESEMEFLTIITEPGFYYRYVKLDERRVSVQAIEVLENMQGYLYYVSAFGKQNAGIEMRNVLYVRLPTVRVDLFVKELAKVAKKGQQNGGSRVQGR